MGVEIASSRFLAPYFGSSMITWTVTTRPDRRPETITAAGAEPSLDAAKRSAADAVRYARDTLGLAVFRGDIDQAGLEPGSFDAVTLIGTIEHMPDPLVTLRAAARLLRPGGQLLITTLNIEGVLRWYEWKPPEHLYYFSFRTLAPLVRVAGLELRWHRWYWAWYSVSDLTARLWRYWRLPGAVRVARALTRPGLERLAVRIPTNEMIVLARKS